jgi:hypothetical protein
VTRVPKRQPPRRRFAWAAGLLLGFAGAAHAAASVGEINQKCAESTTGCFDGDAAGFPVEIWFPGSYQLTGDLNTGSANTSAIELHTGGVQLDLNGFSITGGTAACACPAASCNSSATGAGIHSAAHLDPEVRIRNGRIAGFHLGIFIDGAVDIEDVVAAFNWVGAFAQSGGMRASRSAFVNNEAAGLSVDPGATVKIEDVVANCNGGNGVVLGLYSSVENSIASSNGGDGIYDGGGNSTVSRCKAEYNGGDGIVVSSSALENVGSHNAGWGVRGSGIVSFNVATDNGAGGVEAGDHSNAVGNNARNNCGVGLALGNGSGYHGNSLTCNNCGVCDNSAQVSGSGFDVGINVCGTDAVCP